MKDPNLIFGRHPMMEALKAGKSFEKIFLQSGKSPEINEIKQLAFERGENVQFVPIQKLDSITRKNHQGTIGFLSLIQYYSIEDVLMKVYDEGRVPMFLILDQITDVRNFGGIARTAECTGVDAIIIPEKGGALINADAMKSSAGALNKIHVCKVKKLSMAVDYLKLNGIRLIASEVYAKKKITVVDFSIPLAIILGSEGEGISTEILKAADETFSIPMVGEIGSFNVSVSAGIILYEAMKQRKFAS